MNEELRKLAEEKCEQIGKLISSQLPPKGVGFVLTVYTYGEEKGHMSFISNRPESEAVVALRTLAMKIEDKIK